MSRRYSVDLAATGGHTHRSDDRRRRVLLDFCDTCVDNDSHILRQGQGVAVHLSESDRFALLENRGSELIVVKRRRQMVVKCLLFKATKGRKVQDFAGADERGSQALEIERPAALRDPRPRLEIYRVQGS